MKYKGIYSLQTFILHFVSIFQCNYKARYIVLMSPAAEVSFGASKINPGKRVIQQQQK